MEQSSHDKKGVGDERMIQEKCNRRDDFLTLPREAVAKRRRGRKLEER